jgi:D-cysteine desulfhydrase
VVPGDGDIELRSEWLGAGYGHPTAAGAAATRALSGEGVVLDPVYTGKAGAALLDLNRAGGLGEDPVLFLNTFGHGSGPAAPGG